MIHVAIVEDNIDIQNNIQEFLNMELHFSCTIATDSVENLLDNLTTQSLPDIILMDIVLPGMSGIEGIKLIKQKYPEIDIVMLTVYNDSRRIFEALRAGASGYLLKTTSFSKLKSFIELVHQGGAAMSPQIACEIIQYFYREMKNQPLLSSVEKEVVNALFDGLSYKTISEKMYISVGAVYTYIKSIYKKLQTHPETKVPRFYELNFKKINNLFIA